MAAVVHTAEVERRHGTPVPPRCIKAFLRSVFEGWRTESRHAPSADLQHWRKPLGPVESLAIGLREGVLH